jgi:hypothetical protein
MNVSRTIICLRCSNERRTQFPYDLCPKCYAENEKLPCKGCGKKRFHVEELARLCVWCSRRATRQPITCVECHQHSKEYVIKDKLCLTCAKRKRAKRLKSKGACADCGRERIIKKIGDKQLCHGCDLKRRGGISLCQGRCGKERVIANLKHYLCRYCYEDKIAPKVLEKYLKNYESPFEHSKYYFHLVVAEVDVKAADKKTNQCYRAWGEFLKKNNLPADITREEIEALMLTRGSAGRMKTKRINGCLIKLCTVLERTGKVESHLKYRHHMRQLLLLQKLPAQFSAVLQSYRQWCERQSHTPVGIRSTLSAIAPFLAWCDYRGVHSISEVQPVHYNDYLHTLYWKWICQVCGQSTSYVPWQEEKSAVCSNKDCHTKDMLVKVRRQAQTYISSQTSAIRSFFNWCQDCTGLEITNPVQIVIRMDQPRIAHYSYEYLKAIDELIDDPEADPEVALISYLINFKLLTVSELKMAQIPSLVNADGPVNSFLLVSDYAIIIAEFPRPRGIHAGRRPNHRIEFDEDEVPWLTELLQRYAEQREARVKGTYNHWLLVGQGRAHWNRPVGQDYVRRKMHWASVAKAGVALTPRMLKQSSAVDMTDTCPIGGAILTEFGYGPVQANNYNKNVRERLVIYPPEIRQATRG